MPYNLYISETAYEFIVFSAKRQGYVRASSKNAVGLSAFLERLSYREFSDTRPEWVIRKHTRELENETHPRWSLDDEKKISRYITLSDGAILRYITEAERIGVWIKRRLVNGGQLRMTALSVTGTMIEAYGLGWITPDNQPIEAEKPSVQRAPMPPRSPRPKREKVKHTETVSPENPYYSYLKRGTPRHLR